MAETETTQTTGEPPAEGSKEFNFRALEEKNQTLEAELADLRPLRDKERVREAGFDPDSEKGKTLLLAIKAGSVTPDKDQLTDYAKSEFGWAPTTQLTETERAQIEGSKRVGELGSVTDSHIPPSTDLAAQIAQAEADGDWVTATNLKLQMIGSG